MHLNPPPGVRTEAIEAGLDARKARVLRSGALETTWSAEVRLTTHPTHTLVGGVSTLTVECHARRR